jgi:hypothetical protein
MKEQVYKFLVNTTPTIRGVGGLPPIKPDVKVIEDKAIKEPESTKNEVPIEE